MVALVVAVACGPDRTGCRRCVATVDRAGGHGGSAIFYGDTGIGVRPESEAHVDGRTTPHVGETTLA